MLPAGPAGALIAVENTAETLLSAADHDRKSWISNTAFADYWRAFIEWNQVQTSLCSCHTGLALCRSLLSLRLMN